jgi:inhibitor of cysteine peptidase
MYKRRPMLVSIDRTLTFMAVSDQNFITEGKRRMTRVVIVAILALPLFSLMLAAQQPQSPGAQHKSTPSVVIITDQDNGKDIDLPAGGTLVIRLKSNPSTGYSWAIKGDPSPLRLVKSSTKKNGQNSHAVGAPVTQEFRLTTATAGMASLTLEYRRPWELAAGPAKTFSVKVNAR